MPRQARFVLPDYPHHIVQKGNYGQQTFFDRNDYLKYINLTKDYSIDRGVTMQSYCLIHNHVHMLGVPRSATALADMMHCTAGHYAQYFNNKYQRQGRLWQSRFHSSVVDTNEYLWWVALYIEWNPVRAKLVAHPEEWPYSSANHHATGKGDLLVTEPLFDETDMREYRKLLGEGPPAIHVKQIRNSTNANRPIGGSDFLLRLGQRFGISIRNTRGRPRSISI